MSKTGDTSSAPAESVAPSREEPAAASPTADSEKTEKTATTNKPPTTEGPLIYQSEIESEIEVYAHAQRQMRRLFPRALLVGVLAGAVAVAFRAVLLGGEELRNTMLKWAHQFPQFGWIFPILWGMTGALLAVLLSRNLAPEAAGSGIPHLKAVLLRFRELKWLRVLPVKFIGGALAMGGGLALGREGPTVQMGGAVGAAVADWLKSGVRERLVLIASGAGAGLAAAFNAPLAGLVFVLEELQRDFRQVIFAAALACAAIADVIARWASGQQPAFGIPTYPGPPLQALPAFVVLGVAAGLLGVVYTRSLIGTLNLWGKLQGNQTYIATAAVGGIVGLAAWFVPGAVGGGHDLTERILHGEMLLRLIPLWFLARLALSLLSYATGAPGGIFAPMLVLGALVGLGVGQAANLMAPNTVQRPEVFAVVGMAAYFAAIVRAPLTAVVLILEMTGNYAQMLPLLVACFCAYLTADFLHCPPIYETLLERDLRRNGITIPAHEPMIFEFEVEPGAPFHGKEVRELGLPPGCILVRLRDGGQEVVPTATTRLTAHMRLTALIAPHARQGLQLLRDGCEAGE
ncbi:MAG: H(+)/Cl(-) exchange transporter ClcA [Armatimonadaceae bacterium]